MEEYGGDRAEEHIVFPKFLIKLLSTEDLALIKH